jgi:long-chain acyl-CoA synthetase
MVRPQAHIDVSPDPQSSNAGIYGIIDLETPNTFKTLNEIFDAGLASGKDRPCLGYRPIESTKPLKYADHFVWETYGQVDLRRRHIGSAVSSMFQKGELGGRELDTVGIWSPNRPGACSSIL